MEIHPPQHALRTQSTYPGFSPLVRRLENIAFPACPAAQGTGKQLRSVTVLAAEQAIRIITQQDIRIIFQDLQTDIMQLFQVNQMQFCHSE